MLKIRSFFFQARNGPNTCRLWVSIFMTPNVKFCFWLKIGSIIHSMIIIAVFIMAETVQTHWHCSPQQLFNDEVIQITNQQNKYNHVLYPSYGCWQNSSLQGMFQNSSLQGMFQWPVNISVHNSWIFYINKYIRNMQMYKMVNEWARMV